MPISSTPLIRLENISKFFGPVRANHEITLDIRAGKIKALLGENGAGKSTLMSILAGRLQPDGGRILVDGHPALFRSPREAHLAGVGMVYQHFMLIESMSVAENVLLGHDRALLINPKAMQQQVAELARNYGLGVDPAAKVGSLSMGERQRVEILKLLCRQSRVLIFDEPTAVLTPGEARQLFLSMRNMAAQGKAIVFISHKLPEVLEISDEIAILRRGEIVDAFDREHVPGEAELARRMLGRDLSRAARTASPDQAVDAECREGADPSEPSEPGEPGEFGESGNLARLREPGESGMPGGAPLKITGLTSLPAVSAAPSTVLANEAWLGSDKQLALENAIYNRSAASGPEDSPPPLQSPVQPTVRATVHAGEGESVELEFAGLRRHGRGKLAAEAEPALSLRGVNCRMEDSAGLSDISLSITKGQILAVLGVAGNGQKELVEIICGLRKADSGQIRILGREVGDFHANQPSRGGLGYIPEDRRGSAACPELNLVDNFLLTTRKLFSRWGLMDYKRARQVTTQVIAEHNVQPGNPAALGRALSGGNLQKLIVGRELMRNPRCIVAENPTQGLDVAATEEVWQRLRIARQSSAILLVTGDLNEGLTLADYLAVMYQGRIVDIFSIHNQEKVEQIGLMMAGGVA